MEIARLIERCRQGDADALGELYKAYAQRMRGVCRRYVSDEQDIDDVLHDAFIIIFTSFDRLRDNRKAESWMMSITRNVASKYKDHLDNLPFVPLKEAEALAAPDEEASVRGVPLEDVLRMVERLPEGYGQVFRLSVFDGMSHKEIATMLGIEAHSSSSQLARAKKMLRKMMQQYWAILLLLLIPVTFFLLMRNATVKDKKPVIVKKKEMPKQKTHANELSVEQPQEPVVVHVPVHRTPIDTLQPIITHVALDTLTNMMAHEQSTPDTTQSMEQADTIHITKKPELPHYDIANLFPDLPVIRTCTRQKWSIKLAYAGGMGEQNIIRPYSFTVTPMTAITGTSPSPVTFENWSDYAAYLSDLPDDGTPHSRSVIMNIALNNANQPGNDKIQRTNHHYMPFTWSLAMRYKLSNRFGLESGLSYSRLTSEFEMGTEGNIIHEQQSIHYLSIPVKGIFNIYNRKMWSLYGGLGLTMEIPVYSPLNTSYYLHDTLEATDKTTIRAPWQWSVDTGLGLQYNFTPNVGLFAEPTLQYYIPTRSQIETYRTDHPFTFSLPLGIRFTW